MCTAIQSEQGLFGRTLDYEISFGETVTIAPRNFRFNFGYAEPCDTHFAIIGMATVRDGYPLFYDAVNEKGLAVAGLNFPKSAYFPQPENGKKNIATFELIPYILGSCSDVDNARQALENTVIHGEAFSPELPAASLHWMIADRDKSIVLESRRDGLFIYENTAAVLTNEPPFPRATAYLKGFSHLSHTEPDGVVDSRGTGAVGLPGDYSSRSRFVRAAFLNSAAILPDGRDEQVAEFFNVLGAVEVPQGALRLKNEKLVTSIYTSCIDQKTAVYYYKTQKNSRVTKVALAGREDGDTLISFPLKTNTDFLYE
ncbi:MAG: linear amide C-N hydrolase [Clostridia bacterium]|nr:linear amide C-N hydrolase [Clostridia bacterium]